MAHIFVIGNMLKLCISYITFSKILFMDKPVNRFQKIKFSCPDSLNFMLLCLR